MPGMSLARQERMKTTQANRSTSGTTAFTLIELLILIAIIAILAAMMPRSTRGNRGSAKRINCANNLKQVGLSYRLWAGDYGDKYPMQVPATNGGPMQQLAISDGTGAAYTFQVFQVLSNELNTPKITICPADGDRILATNFGAQFTTLANSAVSYFVGKDADESNPQMYLAGDRNLGLKPAKGWSGNTGDGSVTGFSPNVGLAGNYKSLATYQTNMWFQWTDKLHQTQGNVCLADGSVMQQSSAKMRDGIRNASNATWTYFP